MAATYDKNAPKRAVNVSINADLVTRAKQLGVNLSEALESRLIELVVIAERQRWLAENAEAIKAYARDVEQGILLSDIERPF